MTKQVTVLVGQQMADLAIQYCGRLDAWADIARLNRLGMTSLLEAGSKLWVPDVLDKRVVQYFADGGFLPSTGTVVTVDQGIGFWAIGFDFVVS